jgi:type IV fimbrial biogenesis protein FimT
MQTKNKQSGFTLVEIMVTLLVAGVVIGTAAPSFRDMIANSRLTTTTNNLIAAFSYARSEAIKRAQTVTIDAGADGWILTGWRVRDQAGNTIREFEAPAATVQINAQDDSGDAVTILNFDSRGLLLNQAEEVFISICDDRPNEAGRRITISVTGRPQLNRVFTPCI